MKNDKLETGLLGYFTSLLANLPVSERAKEEIFKESD